MRTIGTPSTQARKLNAIASGALPNGDPVVVNADGTVSVVAAVSQSVGTAATFVNAHVTSRSVTFDSNSNRVVVVYKDQDNSGYGTCVVGTVDPSDNSISFGTPVVFRSAEMNYVNVAFDSNSNKVVVVYTAQVTNTPGNAIIGTVDSSDDSISFGSDVVFDNNVTYSETVFDSSNNKVVIFYADGGNGNKLSAIVGTVSSNSISFGSVASLDKVTTVFSATFDSNLNKVVVGYKDNANSNHGTARVGTVSGTSISFGTAVVFESASIDNIALAYDSFSQKVVIAYEDNGNSQYGTAIVGTVSGTGISFGTAVVFDDSAINRLERSATFDSNANKVILSYRQNASPLYGKIAVLKVSGTSITFDTPFIPNNKRWDDNKITFDSNSNRVVAVYMDTANSNYGTAIVFTSPSTNLTAENYIGLASNGYPDTAGATIDVQGAINDSQSGLTAGQSYYVQTDGTLTTTAGDPSVFAGTAISATKMIVKG